MNNFGMMFTIELKEKYNSAEDVEADLSNYLKFCAKVYENELSYKYYKKYGYLIEKWLYAGDEFSFCAYEHSSILRIIQNVEIILNNYFDGLQDVDYFEITTGGRKNELRMFNPASDMDVMRLLKIHVDLIRSENFLSKMLTQCTPTGVCIWGENMVALQSLYDRIKSLYIEDKGFNDFYRVFLTNNGISQKRMINLINTKRENHSYLLDKIKPFFEPIIQDDYTTWVSENILFKGKKRDKKYTNEILNISKDSGVSLKENIDDIIKDVEFYYHKVNSPQNNHVKIRTALNIK